MANEVNLSAVLNSAIIPTVGTSQLIYVLINVLPSEEGVAVQAPLNFGMVLDRSGSMAGPPIQRLREAVKLILGRMGTQDFVSVIIFDDNVDILAPSQQAANLNRLQGQVDQISDRGGTQMSLGMRKGLEQIRISATPDRISRMLLLTDGQTWGDEDQCRQLASECGQAGIPVSAFGLGEDWNSELLDTIAQASGGVSDHLDTPERIMNGFEETIRMMQGTVVKNATLTLRLVQGVTPRSAWRVVPQITKLDARNLSDRDIQIQLGDLERGTGQSVLVELVMQPRNAGAFRLAQAEVAYDVPATGLTGERTRQDILLTLTDNPAQAQAPNPQVMNLVEKVSVFKLQTRALSEAEAGNIGKATQQLRAAATRLLELGDNELAQTFQQEASNLEQQGQMTAGGTKKLQYQTRKLTQRLDDQG